MQEERPSPERLPEEGTSPARRVLAGGAVTWWGAAGLELLAPGFWEPVGRERWAPRVKEAPRNLEITKEMNAEL